MGRADGANIVSKRGWDLSSSVVSGGRWEERNTTHKYMLAGLSFKKIKGKKIKYKNKNTILGPKDKVGLRIVLTERGEGFLSIDLITHSNCLLLLQAASKYMALSVRMFKSFHCTHGATRVFPSKSKATGIPNKDNHF